MDEIWNIGIFLHIAIIENIRQICERIYISQYEKAKAESIVERIIENKTTGKVKSKRNLKLFSDLKYPFIEYMSYRLKTYGKKTEGYLQILEEIVEKTGTTVGDIIKKEHFNIAIRRVSISNCINSIKRIQRINFLELFEKINGVEELLKQDPAKVYEKMDYKTKDFYREQIKDIAKKCKISEIYVTKKILELAKKETGKKAHIGYYLLEKNKKMIYEEIGLKPPKIMSLKQKVQYYITMIAILTIIVSLIYAINLTRSVPTILSVIAFFLLLIPISQAIIQITQYILSKLVKPSLIPKINLYNGIDEENATMVVVPTILKNKEKVREITRKLEVFYLANKSNNLYFCLLGDCSESDKEIEDYDQEIINEGLKRTKELNQKYGEIFHFAYRRRKWNDKQNSYLGWERKRGALTEFVELLLGNMNDEDIKKRYFVNTFSQKFLPKRTVPERKGPSPNEKDRPQTKRTVPERKGPSPNEKDRPQMKNLITLDSDTDLVLNTAFELVGAMAHILNKPEIKDGKVVDGYGLIQPRVGVNIDVSYKNMFTKIFAGSGGIDSYTNAISDTYQDNFEEGIFTGKGIFNLEVYSKVLKNEIPDNCVLSHDLLEGCYLRCGLASDIMIMDGYPTKYISFTNRLSRWIRGDWQIIKWLKNKFIIKI